MFKNSLVALSILLGLSGCVSMEKNNENISSEILTLDTLADKSFFNANIEYLKTILSEDFIYVHSGAARIETKQETLKSFVQIKFTSWERQTQEVRVYGKETTAMVSGFVTVGFESMAPLKYYVQRLYEKSGENWELVSQHTNFALDSQAQVSEVTKYLYQNYWSKSALLTIPEE